MKSLTAKFASSRGWALLLILFVGAGLLVSACGEEETPGPTTPAPPPPAPPPPPPEPDPPATPTGLAVSATTETSITWTWNAVEGATAYAVQVSMDETFTDDDAIALALDATHTVSDLPASTSVYLRVRSAIGTSLEDALLSDWSTHVTGMTAMPPPPPEPPAVPSGLQVSASGEDFVEWSWNAVEGADGYDVQFSTNEMFDDAETIGRTADETSYRRQLLPAGTTAYVRVRSYSGTGEERLESDWSVHATGMTDQPMPPATPANLRVTARGETYLEWMWDEVADADGYVVQYSDDERFTSEDTTAELEATETSYRIDDLSTEMDVYLRVRSFAGAGADRLQSGWTTHVTGMTTPPAVVAPATPEVTAATGGDDYIEWRWGAVSGADGYEVWYSADVQFNGGDAMHDVGTELTYRQTGLDFDTFGYLRVRAYAGSGAARLWSEWTAEAAIGRTNEAPPPPPDPNAPSGLRVTATGENFVTWSWSAVSDVNGYQIQYSANEAFTSSDPMEDVDAETLSYTRENLDAGTSHYLRVRAFIVADEVRYESDWSDSSRGMTDPLRPAVPAGLAVDAGTTDHDSIGWTWDAVAGVTGYEAQFSLAGTFTGDEQTFPTSRTSHEIHNLAAETAGSLRVRSVMGAGASAVFSDWSEVSTGRTTAPLAPTALPAPANFESTAQTNTSITLAWDEVDDAATYAVEQRIAGGSWRAASCGEVTNTECVASGLDPGTEYNFRVSAIPDSADDTRARSAPATLAAAVSTTGSAPAPITGEGELNVTWRSKNDGTNNVITWRWDQAGDVDYQTGLVTGALDASMPCDDRSVDWQAAPQLSTSFSATLAASGTGSEARALCVRTTWIDGNGDRKHGDPSWAWAAAEPDAPTRSGTDNEAREIEDGITQALTWGVTLATIGQIDYDFRYLVDGQDDQNALDLSDDAANQRLCEAATNAETLTPGGSAFSSFTTTGDLADYSAYHLCYRARNKSGRSDWAVAASGAEIYTAPGRPSAAAPRRTDTAGSVGTSYDFSWVVTKPASGPSVPASGIATNFDTSYFLTNVDADGNGVDEPVGLDDVLDACNGGTVTGLGSAQSFTTIARTSATSNRQLTAGATVSRPANNAATQHIYFCARAKHSSTGGGQDPGPWVISQSTVPKQTQ